MTNEEAELIVHVYGKFLEERFNAYPAYIPISMLPYSMKKIEEAFDIFEKAFSGEELVSIRAARAYLLFVKPDKEAREINKKMKEHAEAN